MSASLKLLGRVTALVALTAACLLVASAVVLSGLWLALVLLT